MCVLSTFSQPTNYCPEESAAVATVVFCFTAITLPPPPPASSLLTVDMGESEGILSPRSRSLGDSLHHCGTHTHTHSRTHVSPLSLSIYHYATASFSSSHSFHFGHLMHIHMKTHTYSSNLNVLSMFVIPCSPDGTRPIGFRLCESAKVTLEPYKCFFTL